MDSQLRMLQKFVNFWSSVSSVDMLKLADNPDQESARETQKAVIYGVSSVQPSKE